MTLESLERQGCVIFTPDFDLDLYHAQTLKETLIQEIRKPGGAKIIFSFQKVKYMDSSGLGAILAARQEAQGRAQIRLCHLPEGVLKVFRLSRLDRLFSMDSDVEESLRQLATSI